MLILADLSRRTVPCLDANRRRRNMYTAAPLKILS